MTDPVIHARMTLLIQDEKKFEEELKTLTDDELPLWKKRVDLALDKGMSDLAEQAKERYRTLRARVAELEEKLELIDTEKKNLRFQARRPSGDEVRRAEAMVESVKLGGLIDPDEARLERELAELEKSDVEFDFGSDD